MVLNDTIHYGRETQKMHTTRMDTSHTSHYASANLIWQMRKRPSIGLEGLYGLQEARSGVSSGDHFRLQLGMVYSLFD